MALAQDILKIFNDMQVPANGDQAAAENAKTDDWMCGELAKVIKNYFGAAIITATVSVAGTIPTGVFSAGTGTANGWTIQDIKSQLLAGCETKQDAAMANAWGSAVESAGMSATCNFSVISGSCVTPAGVTVPTAGPASGTVAGAASGTCGALFLAAFNTKSDEGIASGMAAAITSFVASMQCLVTGTGTIAGALGTATTAPAA